VSQITGDFKNKFAAKTFQQTIKKLPTPREQYNARKTLAPVQIMHNISVSTDEKITPRSIHMNVIKQSD